MPETAAARATRAAFLAGLLTPLSAMSAAAPEPPHSTGSAAVVSQTEGQNTRAPLAPAGADAAGQPASARTPLISFIDSPTGTCRQPDPRQDMCFVNWSYIAVNAAPDYMTGLWITLDGRVVARAQGFFQTSMYIPDTMFGNGFRVRCGPPVPEDPNDPTNTREKGNSYNFVINAIDSNKLKAANYGTVACPPYHSASGAPVVSVVPGSLASTQATNTTRTRTLTIGNTAPFDLSWSLPVSPSAGCPAASVPWLRLSSASGVTPGFGSEPVTVTFDSAGLAPGTYSGHVCVSSGDTFSPRIDVPATLTVQCLSGSPLPSADSLRVDAHDAPIGGSNQNGVFEPGETVLVEPAWRNAGCSAATLTGSAASFTGPGPASYSRFDTAADYGVIGSVAAANCFDATGNCYQVAVSNPSPRPASHWDATLQEQPSPGLLKSWKLHLGRSFTDVPVSHPFYGKVETLFHAGVTAGCTATQYCPGTVVSRSQMAIFIARGIAGSGAAVPASGTVGSNAYNCVSGGASLFTDVPPTDIACKHVHYIAAQNVTSGCAPALFCPAGNVTRLEMAAFMAKAMVAPAGGPGLPEAYPPDPVTGFSYSCSAGSPSIHFADVPASNPFCKHVHFLWARGIISGCSGSLYCPGAPVTRDAMAKFLSNAFELQLYGP